MGKRYRIKERVQGNGQSMANGHSMFAAQSRPSPILRLIAFALGGAGHVSRPQSHGGLHSARDGYRHHRGPEMRRIAFHPMEEVEGP